MKFPILWKILPPLLDLVDLVDVVLLKLLLLVKLLRVEFRELIELREEPLELSRSTYSYLLSTQFWWREIILVVATLFIFLGFPFVGLPSLGEERYFSNLGFFLPKFPSGV